MRAFAYVPTVLQLFLSSPRPTLRFAAVRTLNKVAMTQPMSVTTCNLDLENLITDVNRSIATLAITTLLKVGSCLHNAFISRIMLSTTTTTLKKHGFMLRDLCTSCFQTGNESSVDRLMKQISSFMSEISDEFKIVVVDAIRSVNRTPHEQLLYQ